MESIIYAARNRWLNTVEILQILNSVDQTDFTLIPITKSHILKKSPQELIFMHPKPGQIFLFEKEGKGKNWRKDGL